MNKFEWDLFRMHAHLSDWIYHIILNLIEPSIEKNEKIIKEFLDFEYRCYKSLDDMIGKILKNADDNTYVSIFLIMEFSPPYKY